MSTTEETTAVGVTLSLVSHTNVGKTTLARTLLRRDVGEVLDQAHVTELSEAHELIAADGAVLRLFDTPGFGDSARLLRRLRREGNPVLWFLSRTWDRVTDRPLWCSQQAMLTIRDDTDAVLYLVNATEDPEEAGYVAPELELLTWIGRPVLILLNQTGSDGFRPAVIASRLAAWRTHVARWPVVKEVLQLDAFNRCWLQESVLFSHVTDLLPDDQASTMRVLHEAWNARNRDVFAHATTLVAGFLATAAADREILASKRPSRAEKQLAMEALGARLMRATEDLMGALLTVHGLEGTPAAAVEEAVDAFAVEGEEKIDPERGALLGSVLSGALSGLAADVMSGGLSFGGGLVAGAILGAVGGAGLARGYQMARAGKRAEVRWNETFLDQLASTALLRYLAVAHFGRGRGSFDTFEEPERWRDAVRAAQRDAQERWSRAWSRAASDDGDASGTSALERPVGRALHRVLADAYPEAASALEA